MNPTQLGAQNLGELSELVALEQGLTNSVTEQFGGVATHPVQDIVLKLAFFDDGGDTAFTGVIRIHRRRIVGGAPQGFPLSGFPLTEHHFCATTT